MDSDRYAKLRRDRLRAAGYCINGAGHGPPAWGKTKCLRCIETHRKGAERAVQQLRSPAKWTWNETTLCWERKT